MLEYPALNSSGLMCSYIGWSSTTIIWWTSSDPLIGRVEGLERAWRVVANGSNWHGFVGSLSDLSASDLGRQNPNLSMRLDKSGSVQAFFLSRDHCRISCNSCPGGRLKVWPKNLRWMR